MSQPERIFRPPRWIAAFLGIAAAETAAGAVFVASQEGLSLTSAGLAAFTVLAVLGIVDFLLTRFELHQNHLAVVTLLRRRSTPRSSGDSVTWQGGGGVFLRLKDGTTVRLPDVGNSQSRVNSIRGWLRRADPPVQVGLAGRQKGALVPQFEAKL